MLNADGNQTPSGKFAQSPVLKTTPRTVWRMIGIVSTALIVLIGSAYIFGDADTVQRRMPLYLCVGAMLVVAGSQAQPRPQTAMVILLAGVWLTGIANSWMFAGVYTAALAFIALAITVAGWVLGRRWLIGLTVSSSAWILGLGWVQAHAGTPLEPMTPPMLAAANWVATLVVIAMFTEEARQALLGSRKKVTDLAAQLHQQLQTTRLQRDELRIFLQSIPAAVVEYDAHWRVQRCNERYANFFGTHPDALVGKRFEDFAAQELVDQTGGLKESLAKGKTCVVRMRYHPPLGAPVRWFELRCVPMMRGGSLYRSVVALTDITPVVQAEEALQDSNRELSTQVATQTQVIDAAQRELEVAQETLLRAEAKATIATLVASVTHELNTPVGNSALLASSMTDAVRSLRRDVAQGTLKRSALEDTSTSLLEGMDMLGRNLERIKTLIGQFKQVSADQASERQRSFDLADVVNDTVEAMRPSLRQHRHAVVLAPDPGLGMHSYPGAIGQIVINLINNAYLHAFADGRTGTVTVSARAAADHVVLQVQDDGVGMRDEVRQRLFEPFFSTRFGDGGTGLGMSIVQHLAVKVLGGSVEVSSAPGQGTSFVVTLPRQAPEKA